MDLILRIFLFFDVFCFVVFRDLIKKLLATWNHKIDSQSNVLNLRMAAQIQGPQHVAGFTFPWSCDWRFCELQHRIKDLAVAFRTGNFLHTRIGVVEVTQIRTEICDSHVPETCGGKTLIVGTAGRKTEIQREQAGEHAQTACPRGGRARH